VPSHSGARRPTLQIRDPVIFDIFWATFAEKHQTTCLELRLRVRLSVVLSSRHVSLSLRWYKILTAQSMSRQYKADWKSELVRSAITGM